MRQIMAVILAGGMLTLGAPASRAMAATSSPDRPPVTLQNDRGPGAPYQIYPGGPSPQPQPIWIFRIPM